MTSKIEAAVIKSQLALRYNPEVGSHEVYTRILGMSYSKWIRVSEVTRQWYLTNFPNILIIPFERLS